MALTLLAIVALLSTPAPAFAHGVSERFTDVERVTDMGNNPLVYPELYPGPFFIPSTVERPEIDLR